MYELDHLFVFADVGGPEAARLIETGLSEGEANVHIGQGTACRRFFFHNAFLELLWVRDQEEAQHEPACDTRLWSRWTERRSGTSPFGLCLRPGKSGVGPPFPAWEYRPPYLPAPLVIHVGQGVPTAEPWWFYIEFGRRPDDQRWPRPQPLEHANGYREITGVRFAGPSLNDPSTTGQAVVQSGVAAFTDAPEHCVEVTFDGGHHSEFEDLRPLLPLIFRR